MTDPVSPPPPALVLLGLPLEAPAQRRWTILLRVVLALPLFFVAFWYSLVSLVNVIGAWFIALSRQRVPDSIQARLSAILRWQARFYAYLYLLSDQWPGAHLEYRDGDVADLKIDHVELRRSAVFFRLVLLVPVWIVQTVLSQGLWPFALWMWLTGLFRGRCPATLHQAAALVTRFTIRASAFGLLLTPTMPFRGLFGDAVEAAPGAPAAYSPIDGTPITTEAPPATAAPAPGDAGHPTLPATWVVRRRVRPVLIAIIVIGALTAASTNAWRSTFTRVSNHQLVVSTNNEAAGALSSFAVQAQSCASVACVAQLAHSTRATVLDALDRTLSGWGGSTTSDYDLYLGVLTAETDTLAQMSNAGSTRAAERALYTRLGREAQLQRRVAQTLLATQ